jgi:radical SAM superfamily enzyme YgiQ (UPF0313 family)
MFDNTKPNVILIGDRTDSVNMVKTLGPYKVASVLRQAGFEVAVIHHASVFSLSELRHMLAELISDQTLFVGINNFYYSDINNFDIPSHTQGLRLNKIQPGSILPHGKKYNKEIREYIRKLNPICKLVLGGAAADDLEHHSIFDYVVIGYAEISVLNLAQHLSDSSILLNKSYKSVYGPRIINDSKAEGYEFSNSRMQYADHDAILPNETLTLEVGRGCIFKCAFCGYPMNGKKKLDFIRSKECLLEELLDNYNRFDTTRYLICDDTFNDSVEKCKMFYEVSQQLPFKLEYWAYIRLDLMTAHPETIDYLLDSGLRGLFCGVETLNDKTASAVGKGGNRNRQLATVKRIKDQWGDQVGISAGFVFGLPYESVDSLKQTQEFLLSDDNPFDSVIASPLQIRPLNKNSTYDFLSDIDKNFEKYGYRDLGVYNPVAEHQESILDYEQGTMLWENDFTNFLEAKKMIDDLEQRMAEDKNRRLPSHFAFYLAGGAAKFSDIQNKLYKDIDWHFLDKVKLIKAKQYKKLLFKGCGISPYSKPDTKPVVTYSEWVKAGNAVG